MHHKRMCSIIKRQKGEKFTFEEQEEETNEE